MSVQPARSLGGRFAESTDALLERMNRSTGVDFRLWPHDLAGSLAHARMLRAVSLIGEGDLAAIERGLSLVEGELSAGAFELRDGDEDIHMAVERRLTELVGEPARRLHTGRSRNDQVMTDCLLWMRAELSSAIDQWHGYAESLLDRAAGAADQPMPLMTHYQPAQVGSLGAWFAAHAAATCRQIRRARDLLGRLDECPLGAGAVGGSYLPLDRDMTARALGFARPATSALLATGGRADVLDLLALYSNIGVELSRLGEELVLFTSPAYGWLRLPDRLCTGSSLLPHKRNPDGAELLRSGGKLAASEHAALASVTSGLASGYSKDLQHDKALLFAAADRTRDLVALARAHVVAVEPVPARLEDACSHALAALWLGDKLVLSGVPFREAHHLVGKAVRAAETSGGSVAGALASVLPAELVPIAGELGRMTPRALLNALATSGSAAPEAVRAQVAALFAQLADS